jgi:hypothetical protein
MALASRASSPIPKTRSRVDSFIQHHPPRPIPSLRSSTNLSATPTWPPPPSPASRRFVLWAWSACTALPRTPPSSRRFGHCGEPMRSASASARRTRPAPTGITTPTRTPRHARRCPGQGPGHPRTHRHARRCPGRGPGHPRGTQRSRECAPGRPGDLRLNKALQLTHYTRCWRPSSRVKTGSFGCDSPQQASSQLSFAR